MKLNEFNFIDLHYHADPDLYIRCHHALDAGEIYKSLNGAVVLKSHLGATCSVSKMAQLSHLPVFASTSLNSIAGGINYKVVMRALAEYQTNLNVRLVVDFPTMTGRSHKSKLNREFANNLPETILLQSETVSDNGIKLKDSTLDIIKMARDYPILLTTGHANKQEVLLLIEACEKYGVSKLLLNQPSNPMTGFTAKELFELTKINCVWVEQTILTLLLQYQTEDDFKTIVQNLPKVIYSSDLGQKKQMNIIEWQKYSDDLFEKFSIKKNRKKEICLSNPLELLKV